MTPGEAIREALEANGCQPKQVADGYSARCPAHEDNRASLTLGAGEDGRALLKCHAGCDFASIMKALDLSPSAAFPQKEKRQRGRIVATYAYVDESGNLLSEAVRFEPKGFSQRHPDGRGEHIWNLKGVRRVLYRLPEVLKAKADGQTILVAEGEKDVDNLRKLGFIATCNAMGAEKWIREHTEQIAGAARVVIIPDKDASGRKHAAKVARAIDGQVGEVRVLELPGPGKDASDWISAGGTAVELAALVESAPRPTAEATDERDDARPEIQITAGEGHLAVQKIEVALAASDVYQRGGKLVRVSSIAEPSATSDIRREVGTPIINTLSPAAAWEEVSRAVRCFRFLKREKDWVRCDPPREVVGALLERGDWPSIKKLVGIESSPFLRPDGTICHADGYDAATGRMLMSAGPCAPIPDRPTWADANAALDALLEVVSDFPFSTDAHRSAWVAAILTVLSRPLLEERNRPLFLLDANTPRSGKSRLVDCISVIATGRTAPRVRYTTDDDEMEKRSLSFLQAGDSLVLFDNINGSFGGTTLDALLTSEGWFQGRQLGRSDAGARVRVRNGAVLFATANNATITGDLFGRALHIRLESQLEHPEEREDFRHPDLLGWVRAERPRLLAAALTIIRAWFVAGRPAQKMTAFGSFEGWSELVRGMSLWLRLPDPWAETRQGLRQADNGASLHAELLAGWMELDPAGRGVTCGEAKRILEADLADAGVHSRQASHSRLLDALGSVGLLEDGKVNAQRLGKRLQRLQNRRVQGLWFERQEAAHEGVGRWAVCGSAGVAGVNAAPATREKANDISIGREVRTPATPSTPAEVRP